MLKTRQKLAVRTALSAVLVAFFLGLIFSLVQISSDLVNERENVERTILQILGTLKAPATQAVYVLDDELARSVVGSVFQYEFFYDAALADEFGNVIAAERRSLETVGPRWLARSIVASEEIFKIPLTLEGGDRVIGWLQVKVDGERIASGFLQRSALIIVFGFLRNLLLAAILTFVFYVTLTKPLKELVLKVMATDPKHPPSGPIAIDSHHEEDELGDLTRSVNRFLVTALEDIAARKRDQKALQESGERLGHALRVAKLGNWEFDIASGTSWWSDESLKILGLAPGTKVVRSQAFRHCVHPDDVERSLPTSAEIGAIESRLTTEYRVTWPDGTIHHVEENFEPVIDGNGNRVKIRGTVQDVTERKQIEDQLRQAQKMEVVGQLTAGVAHDFNNLLAVIMSHAEILHARLGDDEHSVESLIKAAARGSDLTKKLLAFSRKQALHPKPVDVHRLITGMSNLLARSLGENIEIEVSTPQRLWPAYADPGLLENAILNLAINARDAMPEGGRITINLANFQIDSAVNVEVDSAVIVEEVGLSPGAYVKIEIVDSGQGISPDVIERVFDPFYTTKKAGEGSGLGLSMVYGFVQQSGGNITISSQKGQGTKVRLYFPRSAQVPLPARKNVEKAVPKSRGETILVLEDDADVREGISKLLSNLGYSVCQSGDGESALAELEANPGINVLLCDVMLSGRMNGPEVAYEARRSHANLKIIFMTGYSDQYLRSKIGSLGDSDSPLTKPVKRVDLPICCEMYWTMGIALTRRDKIDTGGGNRVLREGPNRVTPGGGDHITWPAVC